jgi:lipid-A-disaccharide synthase
MTEEWRTFLYPLGFISALLFGARFIVQWLQSEAAGKSIVTRLFWQISIAGNTALLIHSFIQVQFHVCLIQACNALISWRNLNLMQTKRPPLAFKKVIVLLVITCSLVIIGFILQSHTTSWFRVPVSAWQATTSVPFFWHLLGFLGYGLFSCRFWTQWWLAEKTHTSSLPASFWWLSIIGAITSCLYFLRIHDLVNLIGPLIGLIPYLRNLMLIYKTDKLPQRL